MLGFRVWSTENKCFIKDRDYLITEKGQLMEFDGSNFLTSFDDNEDGLIPMQSTGMIDLNYNTIYEGDIVRKKCLTFGDETTTHVWDVTAWLRTMPSSGFIYSLEILGNAYENPELLPDWKDVKYD